MRGDGITNACECAADCADFLEDERLEPRFLVCEWRHVGPRLHPGRITARFECLKRFGNCGDGPIKGRWVQGGCLDTGEEAGERIHVDCHRVTVRKHCLDADGAAACHWIEDVFTFTRVLADSPTWQFREELCGVLVEPVR